MYHIWITIKAEHDLSKVYFFKECCIDKQTMKQNMLGNLDGSSDGADQICGSVVMGQFSHCGIWIIHANDQIKESGVLPASCVDRVLRNTWVISL